ncbi:MAG TPA: hypothetical protein VM577_00970 [Anaerovoracaceae bacterium]|nr:hypothetical protein [Anaerovoracaceae bacterium]
MPCYFRDDVRLRSTMINGIQYITVSFFDGDKLLFDKIGDLIIQSFHAMKGDEVPNENISKNSVAMEKD